MNKEARNLAPEEYISQSLETVHRILGEHLNAGGRNLSQRLQQAQEAFPGGLIRTLKHLDHLNKRILHDEDFELYNTGKVVKSCTWALHSVEEMAGLRDPRKRYESSNSGENATNAIEQEFEQSTPVDEVEATDSWFSALRNAAAIITLTAACVVFLCIIF